MVSSTIVRAGPEILWARGDLKGRALLTIIIIIVIIERNKYIGIMMIYL
jgi:hypothetical protein